MKEHYLSISTEEKYYHLGATVILIFCKVHICFTIFQTTSWWCGKPLRSYNKTGKLLSSGFIALQSEGHPVDFRNIEIMDLSYMNNN